MTKERASELITENLTAIYGFAFGRLYDKDKVEDLASEIVCEILASVKNLEKEEAFWGFAWRIAENYNAISGCQYYNHADFFEKAEVMCVELIEKGFVTCTDGALSANFPVFTTETYKKVQELVAPMTELVCDCMLQISEQAEKMLTEQVPLAVWGVRA